MSSLSLSRLVLRSGVSDLRSSRLRAMSVTQEFVEDRCHGQSNDDDDSELEVVFDEVDLAEEVAECRDADGPRESADDVETDKCPLLHLPDAGDDR